MKDRLPEFGGKPRKNDKNGYSGMIPKEAIIALEKEMEGLMHGTVTLTFHVKGGKLTHAIGRERSHMEDDGD
jgi:hypothetical protein